MDDIKTAKYICVCVSDKTYIKGKNKFSRTPDIKDARLFKSPGLVSMSVGRKNIESGEFVIVPVEVTLNKADLTAALLGFVDEEHALKPRR